MEVGACWVYYPEVEPKRLLVGLNNPLAYAPEGGYACEGYDPPNNDDY
jgi:hypothetical protein